jgi:drug/metabolite transporter (DMT)-like permease
VGAPSSQKRRPSPAWSPLAAGTLIALGSAVLFGVATPAVQRFGRGAGPFTTAALLYGGAAALSAATRGRRGREAPLAKKHLPRLLAVAVAGAVIAPVALAFGLARASGAAASLLLNLEAAFTIALGALLHREHVGRRLVAAAAAMTAGGAVLLVTRGGAGRAELVGLGAVAVATLGWALDNALGRPLADLDPGAVVVAKGALGAGLSLALAILLRDAPPRSMKDGAALLACGALGYGLSLRLYLLAQRRLGAGRTASVFAAAPFVGALVAWILGEPGGGLPALAAGVLMAFGAYLHLTEKHDHRHRHHPLEHEHAHRHDDGHHDDHTHEPMPEGAHSHWHRHEPREHEHAHGADVHHGHDHA